jgi:hypothetical protein
MSCTGVQNLNMKHGNKMTTTDKNIFYPVKIAHGYCS